MENTNYARIALDTWGILATKYDDATPTPPGLSPDLVIYFNGELNFKSIDEWRQMMSEVHRRHPDWHNNIVQEFGDEHGQCIVWHSTANLDKPHSEQVNFHGVTLLESEKGVVTRVDIYFETDTSRLVYNKILELRAV